MGASNGPRIVTNNLVFNVDAADPRSYDGYENLLTYSEQLNTWSKLEVNVTSNGINSPIGTLTADKIVEASGGTNQKMIYKSITPFVNRTYAISIWAKAAERSLFRIGTWDGIASSTSVFNLTTGSVTSVSGSGSPTASIEAFSNGWYRCKTIYTTSAGGTYLTVEYAILSSNGDRYFSGDGVSGIWVWGAQLELGGYVNLYWSTEASTKIRSVSWFDFLSSTGNGTLLNGALFDKTNYGAIVFDGTNDYITCPNFSLGFGNTDFSVELMLFVQATSNNFGIFISGSGPFNLNSKGCELRFQTNTLEYGINDSSGVATRLQSNFTNIADGAWPHIVITQVKTGIATLYVNGSQIKTADYSGESVFSDVYELRIGRGNDGYLNGKIALFKVYNGVLSSLDVLQNFNALKSRFGLR